MPDESLGAIIECDEQPPKIDTSADALAVFLKRAARLQFMYKNEEKDKHDSRMLFCLFGITHTHTHTNARFTDRLSDIYINAFPACGVPLLQQILHQLRTGGDEKFDEISNVVPFIRTTVVGVLI
jgi:hypothetical protein